MKASVNMYFGSYQIWLFYLPIFGYFVIRLNSISVMLYFRLLCTSVNSLSVI